MREEILALQRGAMALDPGPEARAQAFEQVRAYSESFLQNLEEGPVYNLTAEMGSGLRDDPIGEEAIPLSRALALIRDHVDSPGMNAAAPGHMAYIPGGGLYYSALGDFLADVSNRYAGLFLTGPGAVRMEHMLLDWVAHELGYPPSAGGNLTTGGSLAYLISIVAARRAFDLQPKNFDRAVVYHTQHLHHALDKALNIALSGACIQRHVPMDVMWRLDPEALEQQVLADREAGLIPWMVVASAGTVHTGQVDPLEAVADVASRQGLWYHIDAAYGGFFMLTEHGRTKMKGIARSDSVVLDPHKSLFLPYGSGVVLIREKQKLIDAFSLGETPAYLSASDELSPADLSPELTKHFRGPRMWLPLKLCGVATFRVALEEKLLLARYAWNHLAELAGWEVGPSPDLSLLTFRYLPKNGDVNPFNKRLCAAVVADGRIYLSTTLLAGQVFLRLAILSFRTHLDTVETALQILEEKATRLDN